MWQMDVAQPEEFIAATGIPDTIKLCLEATFGFEDQTARFKTQVIE